MKANPVGVYVTVQINNPNYNPSGIILSKQAQQSKEIEPKGKLVEIGNKCEWLDHSMIGCTVMFRPNAAIDIIGDMAKDEHLTVVMAESSIHCYLDNDGVV